MPKPNLKKTANVGEGKALLSPHSGDVPNGEEDTEIGGPAERRGTPPRTTNGKSPRLTKSRAS